MKNLFTLFLMLITSIGTIFASNTSVDGIWYNFNSSTLTAVVTYRGESVSTNEYTGIVSIPSSVTYNGQIYRVTRIGEYAFMDCTDLTSIDIPNTITSIGNLAFNRCSGLTSIEIPNSVTNIEDGAFWSCTGLTSVSIPSSIIRIGNSIFLGCSSLTSVEIPNSVTSIGNSVFYNCTSLASVTLPNSVTSIGASAFNGCRSLTSIEIPNSVTSIEASAFNNCANLTDIYVTCGDLNRIRQLLNYDNRVKYMPLPFIVNANATNGIVYFPQNVCDSLELTVNPNYGYHFTKWSDGNTENPRPIELTQDTTFTAEFAPNLYTISITCDEQYGTIVGESGEFEYLTEHSFKVIANNGYYFYKWSDGNTDNPRTIELTQDTTFEAIFEDTYYKVNAQINNAEMGAVIGGGLYEILSQVTISAIPNYGYHFVKWLGLQEEIPQNSITPSQAYSIAAALSPGAKTSKQYTIVGYVTGKYGTYANSYYLSDSPDVSGKFVAFKCNTSANIGDRVIVTGYLTNYKGTTPETTSGATLTKVVDISSFNPYTFTITQDTTITAVFAKNTYTLIAQTANSTMGSVNGGGTGEYLDSISIKATPAYGYHFFQWNDGNTDTIRTIVLTKDTTITAEFAADTCGKCGDNLVWSLTDSVLIINGYGAMWDGQPWLGARESIQQINFPQDITSIGEYAFSSCSSLTSITIPNSVTSIGDGAFMNCTGLTSFEFPNSVTSIEAGVLYGCSGLTSIAIPNNVTSIEGSAFYDCTGLTSMTIPNNVTSIGVGAFYHCSGLTSIEIPNSVTSIGQAAFAECNGLTSINIGNSVTSIGDYAFYGCSCLTSLTVGDSVTSIGSYVFNGCNSLTSVTLYSNAIVGKNYNQNSSIKDIFGTQVTKYIIGNGVTSIGNYAFYDCSNIFTISLPSTLVSIGVWAFNTQKILNVYNYSTTPQDMNSYSGSEFLFRGILANANLYVPQQSIELYRETYFWCYFGNIKPLQTPTAIDQVNNNDDSYQHVKGGKILKNGQILILRGDKTYTLQGQEVR